MLIIAHRLNTIIDSDQIMVLDAVQVMEYDIPEKLLLNETSAFSKMVQITGAANAQYLWSLLIGEGGENKSARQENIPINGRRWFASSHWAAAAHVHFIHSSIFYDFFCFISYTSNIPFHTSYLDA